MSGKRNRRLAGLGALLLVMGSAGLVLLAGGDSASARHESPRFSFSYPAEWGKIEGERPAGIGDFPDYGRHAFGSDRDHLVIVAYLQDLPEAITMANVGQLIPGYQERFARFNEALTNGGLDASVELAPAATGAAGLPAVESRMTSLDERDRMIRTRSTTIYRGREQYSVICRRPVAEDARARAADRGCGLVLDTLQVTGDDDG